MSGTARADASGAESSRRAGARPARGSRTKRRSLPDRIALFVRQVIAELKKVVRPSRADLIGYATAAIVFVAVIMAFVTVVDLGVGSLIGWVFG